MVDGLNEGLLTENDMAASLLPIYEDPATIQQPDVAIESMRSVFDQGDWDDDAKNLLAEKSDEIQKASGNKLDVSWLEDISPPPENPELSEEENLAVIKQWRGEIESSLAESGADWYLVKNEASKILDRKALDAERQIRGGDVGRVRDAVARSGNTALALIPNALGDEETGDWLENYFDTNPQFDDTVVANIADVIGQVSGQGGTALVVGGAAAIAGAPALVATGIAATTGALLMGSLAYQDTYKNIYEETGDRLAATEAAIERSVSEAGIEAISGFLVGKKLIEPFINGLSASRKRKVISGVINAAGTAIPVEGVTEALQSINQQAIEGQITGEDIDFSQALEEGLYGAVGGAFLGTVGGVASGIFAKDKSDVQVAPQTPEEAQADEQLALPAPLLGLPAPATVITPQDTTTGETQFGETPADTSPVLPGERPAQRQIPLKPLSEEQQTSLAARLEAFKDDPNQTVFRVKNIVAQQIPADLLGVLDMRAEDTGFGVEFRKNDDVADTLDAEGEQVEPIAPGVFEETLRRINKIPQQITELEGKLKAVPTEMQLRKRILGARKYIINLQKGFAKVKNPIGVARIRETIARQANILRNYENQLIQEVKYGKLSKEREAIKNRIDELTLQLSIAKNYETVQDAKLNQSMVRSNITGSKSTLNIADNLRHAIDYWIAGFGLPNLRVGTFDDLEAGLLDDANPAMLTALKNLATTSEGLSAYDTKLGDGDNISFILVKDGSDTVEGFNVASHEIGHIVFSHLLEQAPVEVQSEILDDYLESVNRAKKADTVGEAGDIVIGPRADTSTFVGDLPLSILDQPRYRRHKDYLLGQKGFEEYVANRVSQYLTDPSKKPYSGAESFYKNVADAFKRIWRTFRSTFGESPSFEAWLDTQFKIEKDRKTLSKTRQSLSEKLNKQEAKERERTVSKRVRVSRAFTKRVRDLVGVQTYEVQGNKPIQQEAKQAIASSSTNIVAERVLAGNVPNGQTTLYATEVVESYNRQINEAKTPELKKQIEDTQEKFISQLAELGTLFGREVQGLYAFAKLTKTGTKKFLKKDITQLLEKANIIIPENMSDEVNAVVDEYYDRIQRSPDGGVVRSALYQGLVGELANRLPEIASVGVGWFYWYGNILTGVGTQAVNAWGGGINLTLQVISSSLAHPKDIPTIMSGLARGAAKGLVLGKGAVQGRKLTKRFEVQKLDPNKNSLLTPQVNWENKFLKKGFNGILRGLQVYPFNYLTAVDAFVYRTAYEAQAGLATNVAIRRAADKKGIKLTPELLARSVANELHNSDAEVTKAKEEAREDWKDTGLAFNANDVDIRAFEILDAAQQPGLVETSTRAGLEATFLNRPQGTFGVLADLLNSATKRVKGARLLFPFVNIATNIASRGLDFTPYGFVRYWEGGSIFTGERFEETSLERRQRLASAFFGLGAASTVYALAEADLEDKNPFFAIYARGPKSAAIREDWFGKGASQYTIKVGDTYLKYSETVLAPMFAFIGELHDAFRFSPSFQRKDWQKRGVAAMSMMGASLFDTGILRSLSDVIDTVSGDRDPVLLPTRSAKGLIPFQGLLKDIAKITDPDLSDSKDVAAAAVAGVPFVESLTRDRLNVFGDTIPKPGRFFSLASKDPIWRWLIDNDLRVPGLANKVTIGKGSSTREKAAIRALGKRRQKDMGRFAYEVLTEDERYKLLQISGPKIKSRVRALSQRKRVDRETYQKLISKITSEERQRAKKKILFGR